MSFRLLEMGTENCLSNCIPGDEGREGRPRRRALRHLLPRLRLDRPKDAGRAEAAPGGLRRGAGLRAPGAAVGGARARGQVHLPEGVAKHLQVCQSLIKIHHLLKRQ